MQQTELSLMGNTRCGAYGVVIKEGKLLLSRKKAGPYQGLWDLPGGGIEFGEAPEEALERELVEETALKGSGFELIEVVSVCKEAASCWEPLQFHFIGVIYRVNTIEEVHGKTPEEENSWFSSEELKVVKLAHFAQQAVLFV